MKLSAKEIVLKLRDVLKMQFAEEEVTEKVTETTETTEPEATETTETVETVETVVEPTVEDRLTALETSVEELKGRLEEIYNYIQDVAKKAERPDEEIKEEIREEVIEQLSKAVPSAKPLNETAGAEKKLSKTDIMVDFIRNFKK